MSFEAIGIFLNDLTSTGRSPRSFDCGDTLADMANRYTADSEAEQPCEYSSQSPSKGQADDTSAHALRLSPLVHDLHRLAASHTHASLEGRSYVLAPEIVVSTTSRDMDVYGCGASAASPGLGLREPTLGCGLDTPLATPMLDRGASVFAPTSFAVDSPLVPALLQLATPEHLPEVLIPSPQADQNPVVAPRTPRVLKAADDASMVTLSDELDAAITRGDIATVERLFSTEEPLPADIAEALHLLSTDCHGHMPPHALEHVVPLAEIVLRHFRPHCVVGSHGDTSRNPWYLTVDRPELVRLYHEHRVPLPRSSAPPGLPCGVSVSDSAVEEPSAAPDVALSYIALDLGQSLLAYIDVFAKQRLAMKYVLLACRHGAVACATALLNAHGLDFHDCIAGDVTALDEVVDGAVSTNHRWTPSRLQLLADVVTAGVDLARPRNGALPCQRLTDAAPVEVARLLRVGSRQSLIT
jgi:hypothetical protein